MCKATVIHYVTGQTKDLYNYYLMTSLFLSKGILFSKYI